MNIRRSGVKDVKQTQMELLFEVTNMKSGMKINSELEKINKIKDRNTPK